MLNLVLTPDNIQLQTLKTGDEIHRSEQFEINFANKMFLQHSYDDFPNPKDVNRASVEDLVRELISSSTRIAFESDLKHFAAWGGSLPATSTMIAKYIAEHAGRLAVATISRRVATLSKTHQMLGAENPCQSALVKATLKGLRRKQGTAQKQAKALIRDDLFMVIDALGDSLKDVRDRALLLLGFAGGFRRSELVGLNVEDIEPVRQGLIITLRHSKTDQEGRGRKIGIPYGRTRHCPVEALTTWLERAEVNVGAIFHPINRHGQIQSVSLSGDAVSEIIRERLANIGIDPNGYSGHSLRAGFATSAVQAGVSTLKIRAQTGHASDAILGRYIRDGELFSGNATGAIL